MEEDELLQDTDEDCLSESEEQRLTAHSSLHNALMYPCHTKCEFLITKALLILSTAAILILLPLYMEVVTGSGNVYSLLFTNSLISLAVLIFVVIVVKFSCSRYKHVNLVKLPMSFLNLGLLSLAYFGCGVITLYALDQKRVVCHLQDPMKGLVLLWAFLFYFISCKKFIGLERIFAATAIIGGLFIAVDYSICNEFKCRGYNREHISDDTGLWTFEVHAIWTLIYIFGLAVFAGYFTLLERKFLVLNTLPLQEIENPALNTVSHSVSTATTHSPNTTMDDPHTNKNFAPIHLAAWLHVFGLLIVIAFFWIEFIPHVGKGTTTSAFLNYTANGIICHFETHTASCNDLPLYSWLFVCSYVVFVISSVKFLILTQSAIYTVATMTAGLPLTGVWWSFAHMIPLNKGLIVWAPAVTGELISSWLGLPVITVGLYVFYKCHFKDYMISKMVTSDFFSSQ